jgi:hypothetical protein
MHGKINNGCVIDVGGEQKPRPVLAVVDKGQDGLVSE